MKPIFSITILLIAGLIEPNLIPQAYPQKLPSPVAKQIPGQQALAIKIAVEDFQKRLAKEPKAGDLNQYTVKLSFTKSEYIVYFLPTLIDAVEENGAPAFYGMQFKYHIDIKKSMINLIEATD